MPFLILTTNCVFYLIQFFCMVLGTLYLCCFVRFIKNCSPCVNWISSEVVCSKSFIELRMWFFSNIDMHIRLCWIDIIFLFPLHNLSNPMKDYKKEAYYPIAVAKGLNSTEIDEAGWTSTTIQAQIFAKIVKYIRWSLNWTNVLIINASNHQCKYVQCACVG